MALKKKTKINVSKVKVRTATAELTEDDFTSAEEIESGSIVTPEEEEMRQFIGLELEVKTQFPMSVKKGLMGMSAIQGVKDPNKILEAFARYSDAMAKLIVDWSLVDAEGNDLLVSVEALDNLEEPLQMAVFQVFNKAIDQEGGLEKN